MDEKKRDRTELPRRAFLGRAAAAGVGAVFAVQAKAENASVGGRNWTHTADVIVVGSGAAALSAAIAATKAGASVIVLEKAPVAGGTTSKSDGAYWIPNNHHLRAQKLADPKSEAMRYMVRGSYPTLYREEQPRFGVGAHEYELIEAYYDNAASIVEDLENSGVIRSTMFDLPDYQDHEPDGTSKLTHGRILVPLKPDGGIGQGRELIRQMRAWLDAHKVVFLFRHAVNGIERNTLGQVIGVAVTRPDGTIFVRAKKGVVFGSGGFTHNPDLMLNFQPGPSWGGCAVPTNQGDLVKIGVRNGAKIGNMVNAWRAELLLESAMESASVPRDIWQPPGDSMILVNKHGRRVVDEKRNYHERTRAHFVWDAVESEYPNKLLYMIYDKRTAELFAGNYPLPGPGQNESYVIQAPSLAALGDAIQARLDSLREKIGREKMAENFSKNLGAQIALYNDDAKRGVDTEFQRGKYPYDGIWHTQINSKPRTDTNWKPASPNPTVFPIDTRGPFFAIILGAGTLDTNGGPVIDTYARILDVDGKPIPGLYGAGNCIASPAASAYWGAGGTIGPAMTFGTLAGRHAALETVKDA
ncbi:FAD-dependent oxidoreductase [Burkholderia sp. Bp9142]|uniref:FAD-dependent oxidoreductase n=1 Tax=Burkholderia sp. Bp9142 TaxID=2184573 RepID=UPI000F59761A|nr:FAD-dependent oxidoreductase [Burkholderia sp. Bp9142]RQR27564.1 FAD-dependent oxidoreductase [Burkholderia sp. Bp9142]